MFDEEYKLRELARQEMEISFLQQAILHIKSPKTIPDFDINKLIEYFIERGFKKDLIESLFIDNIMILMNEDEFDKKFNLVTNHLNPNSSFDGYMFETYGEELDYIVEMNSKAETKNKIWTVVEGDDESMYYISGYHIVNRIGYLITEEEVRNNTQINVKLN